jgi:hypothetical protein
VSSYMNEDVMWQRLKDLQMEAENRRLAGASPGLFALLRFLGARAWLLAGLASRRPPRRWVEGARHRDAGSRAA